MVGNSIRRVRQAEDEAEDIVEEAAEQVERLKSDTAQDCSMKVLSAKQKARAEAQDVRTQVLREADEEVGAIEKCALTEREALVREADRRSELAVKVVLEMLEADWRG